MYRVIGYLAQSSPLAPDWCGACWNDAGQLRNALPFIPHGVVLEHCGKFAITLPAPEIFTNNGITVIDWEELHGLYQFVP